MFFDDSELGSYREPKSGGSKAEANKPSGPLRRMSFAPKPREFATLDDMLALPIGTYVVWDMELYINYGLIAFKVLDGPYFYFEHSCENTFPLDALGQLLWGVRIVGFNSLPFDQPLVELLLSGASLEEMKALADEIIKQDKRVRPKNGYNHIDLIEVAPLQASLKAYGARLHSPRIQELPIPPEAVLTREEGMLIRDYCFNDLDETERLFKELRPQIELRILLSNQYNVDLRSKSDAQIAEAIINAELERLSGKPPQRPKLPDDFAFQYDIPEFISYHNADCRDMLEILRGITFTLDAGGSPAMPKELSNLSLRIGNGVYRMGIGGLHSSESKTAYVADDDTLIVDRDVESYYPRLILTQRLAPEHLGEAFLEVFETIVNRRLTAKRTGDKAVSDALKITINGTFGKLGNKYSTIYSPKLLSQVTISGQLYLLMLIDMIEHAGIPVISANTDGIVMHCPKDRYDDLNAIIAMWESLTDCVTEETRYAALYSRDVNNYIAVKLDGSTKAKGVFSERGSALNSPLSKNPMYLICSDAVQAFLSKGVPINDTITSCTDWRRFVCVQNVRGGGHKDGVYLGKVVRWYYAVGETGTIHYISSGNTVPRSEGGKPAPEIDSLPDDVDYERYIAIATEMLFELGYYRKPEAPRLI